VCVREREKETDKQTDRQRQRETDRERETETDRQTEGVCVRVCVGERERAGERETVIGTDTAAVDPFPHEGWYWRGRARERRREREGEKRVARGKNRFWLCMRLVPAPTRLQGAGCGV